VLSLACAALAPVSAPAAESFAIVNAHIYTMGHAGEIATGTVVIRDGHIAAVGAGL